MSYRVEPLDGHELEEFVCGNAELDAWLISHARSVTGQGTRTYVSLDDRDQVVGYFAIAPHYLNRDDAPRRLGRGAPRQIPGILLAKLALAKSVQGQGLGAELLVAALGTILDAARRAGGRIVVIDAIDDNARRFYECHDFEFLPGHKSRLVMKLSTAAKALGLDWP